MYPYNCLSKEGQEKTAENFNKGFSKSKTKGWKFSSVHKKAKKGQPA